MADLIDREQAIDAIANYIHNVDKVMGTGKLSAYDCKDAAESVLEELPSAQPERKKGKWGKHGECSFCGYLRQWGDDKFCANCGAEMRGEQNETD